MGEEVFGPVVLVVTVGVVYGREVLIALGDLPDDDRASSSLARRADVVLPAMEVGKSHVRRSHQTAALFKTYLFTSSLFSARNFKSSMKLPLLLDSSLSSCPRNANP